MKTSILLKPENIATQIFFLRGEKVMLDFHLSSLYGVETRTLKQQVRRNLNRFPADFMFQLTKKEWQELITICDNLGAYRYAPSLPFAFTEQGIAMLSSVLKGPKAVAVNIAVMRTFVQLRRLMDTNADLRQKIETLEKDYDERFNAIVNAIKKLIREERKPRKQIGYPTRQLKANS